MIADGLQLVAGSGLSIQMLDDARRGPQFPSSPTDGSLWELTEVSGNFIPGIYEFHQGWNLRNPAHSALSYDLSGTVLGKPDPSAKVLYVVASRTFYLQGSLAGAIAYALQASSSQQDFSVGITRKSEYIPVGMIRFKAYVEEAEFVPATTDPIRVERGDILIITAPDLVDSTIADISITLCGYLSV